MSTHVRSDQRTHRPLAQPVPPQATPLTIGRVRLPNRAFLAPMAGITDGPMRRLALEHGAGLAVSEMVAGAELVHGGAAARLKSERAGAFPHVVQLAGCQARWMGEAARAAADGGAEIIDINMGCPAKRVVGGWSGSALMRDPDHAVRLIDAVVAAVDLPVTVKMRLGWDADSLNAPELAARAEAAGAAMITVHGRTRADFYKGRADWAAIRRVKDAVRVPVVANGDVTDVADAPAILEASGADAVMIGRGAQGRPWFVGDVAHFLATGTRRAEPGTAERLALLVRQYDDMLTLYGRALGLRVARKHLAWALAAWPVESRPVDVLPIESRPGGEPALRRAILTSEDPAMVMSLLGTWFGTEPAGRAAAGRLAA